MLNLDGLAKETILDEDKVNGGVWIHLDGAAPDPDTGKPVPMYLDGDLTKPQRALVRSYRCKTIKDAEAKRQKDGFVKLRLAKKKERDGVIAESSILPEDVRFSYLLVALDNFSSAGGVQQVSLADAKALHSMTSLDHIVQQIREAAFDDDNYLATAETAPGKASPSATLATTMAEKTPLPASQDE